MSNTMLKLFFACICIGYTVSINAQESINGRILDEHEQGFEAAVVMLVSLPENVLIETAVTDSTGRFHLPVHKGEFLLCIRSLGYKEKTKNITISGPNTIPDIYLEPDEIFYKMLWSQHANHVQLRLFQTEKKYTIRVHISLHVKLLIADNYETEAKTPQCNNIRIDNVPFNANSFCCLQTVICRSTKEGSDH